MSGAPSKVFKVVMSERCYRFKPDALPSHAPPRPGVYEFVTFREGAPIVLYVGLALDSGGVHGALAAHLENRAEPTAEKLFAEAKDVYFDYVARADIADLEDLKDIAGALVARHKPRFNAGPPLSSGRYGAVTVEEAE